MVLGMTYAYLTLMTSSFSVTHLIFTENFKIVRGVILGKPAELSILEKKKEHLRNTKTAAKGFRIANHAWSNNHVIDSENAAIMTKAPTEPQKH